MGVELANVTVCQLEAIYLGIDLKIFHERKPNPIKQDIYASLSLRYEALLGLTDKDCCNCQLFCSYHSSCIKAVSTI